MKKYSSYFLAISLSAGLFLTSCKKENTTQNPDDKTEATTQADDQEQFAAETDDVTGDVNASIENKGGTFTGRPNGPELPVRCDATITVDTTATTKTITITYNGNCLYGRSRSGTVIVSFANDFRWNTPGATLTVTYQNVKVKRIRGDKTITINGTMTHTNVSGGLLRNLATTSPVIHEIKSSNMSVTFDNGTARTWNVAKRRTFTYEGGIVIAVTGIGNVGDGVAEWGKNRFGTDFTTTILTPLTIKQTCNFRLVNGKIKHTVGAKSITTTFGLDATGAILLTCPAVNLPFYLKVEWVGANGGTGTLILPY